MKKLIEELKQLKKDYSKIARDYEKRGLHNLEVDEVEYYGAYIGKADLCEDLLKKYGKAIKK